MWIFAPDVVSLLCTSNLFGEMHAQWRSKEDLQRMPDNIFLELIKGVDIGTTVYYRDDNYLVFDDKFGVHYVLCTKVMH